MRKYMKETITKKTKSLSIITQLGVITCATVPFLGISDVWWNVVDAYAILGIITYVYYL